ncbi:hypothetical protein [Stenotrophomonas maltophilia]|nr:hypothetical protein [Stenotrophomonas maltophilia]
MRMNRSTWRYTLMSAIFIGLSAAIPCAWSLELDIMAEFRPNALNPSHNRFVNTTPESGLCVIWASYYNCKAHGVFSLALPIDVSFLDVPADGDARQSFHLKIPSRKRTLKVSNGSHESEVAIRIGILAGDAVLPADVRQLVGADPSSGAYDAHYALWDGSWGLFLPPAPCRGRGGPITGTAFSALFVWEFADDGSCVKRARHAIPGKLSISRGLSFSYELVTPDPLLMQNGIYRGRLDLDIGPGGDFDFGDNAVVSDRLLSLNFTLHVAHDFQVNFAGEQPGVQLVPEGGWSQWSGHGRAPRWLRQELPFHLTTSMDFSMKLRCEFEAGGRCGIRNAGADVAVPVDLDVTIPGMSNVRDGRPAQNAALLPDDARAPRFTPDGYLVQRRSTLRFTAGRDAVTEMLKSPGSHWQGNMTVVFDANP